MIGYHAKYRSAHAERLTDFMEDFQSNLAREVCSTTGRTRSVENRNRGHVANFVQEIEAEPQQSAGTQEFNPRSHPLFARHLFRLATRSDPPGPWKFTAGPNMSMLGLHRIWHLYELLRATVTHLYLHPLTGVRPRRLARRVTSFGLVLRQRLCRTACCVSGVQKTRKRSRARVTAV